MMPQASPLTEHVTRQAASPIGPPSSTAIGTPAGPGALAENASVARPASSGVLLALFFLVILLPINPVLGTLRLTPSRIYLIILFIPFAWRLASGKAGRLTWVDGGMLAFAILVVATLLYHHGTEELPYGLSQAIEMFGGYMTGRLLVRNLSDYRRFIRYFLIALLIILPLAIYELFNSRMFVADLFRPYVGVIKKNVEFRFELSRVQVVFPHSILYGLFCSLALASVYYIYRSRFFRMTLGVALVFATALMSLSSAPMISLLLQTTMVVWDRITRGSWKLLTAIVAFIYVLLQLFTNRGALVIFIETMTLDPVTGWWRIHIWTWGTRTVMAYPLLGIGLNDWERPSWLTASVDNFWLLIAMSYGLPCLMFILMAIALHMTFILRARNLPPEARMIRTGYMITLVGLIFTLSTVDIWDAMSIFVFFFFGAGAFLYTADLTPVEAPIAASPAANRDSGPQFSRFPQTAGPARYKTKLRGTERTTALAPPPTKVPPR